MPGEWNWLCGSCGGDLKGELRTLRLFSVIEMPTYLPLFEESSQNVVLVIRDRAFFSEISMLEID